MKKYIEKTVVIEAVQLTKENLQNIHELLGLDSFLQLNTFQEIIKKVSIGDYIIKEGNRFYNLSKKQFESKYIEVNNNQEVDEFCIPSYKNAPPPPPKLPTPESQGLVKPVPPQPRYVIENPSPVTFPQLLILCSFCLVIIIVGMLSGCTIEERQRGRSQEAKEIVNNLTYVQDKRTGLCFGIIYPDRQDQSLTLVPCEKVEKYLK